MKMKCLSRCLAQGRQRMHTNYPELHTPARSEAGKGALHSVYTGFPSQKGVGLQQHCAQPSSISFGMKAHGLRGSAGFAVEVSKPEILKDLPPGRGILLPGFCGGSFANLTQPFPASPGQETTNSLAGASFQCPWLLHGMAGGRP